jgi:hypothetical protein
VRSSRARFGAALSVAALRRPVRDRRAVGRQLDQLVQAVFQLAAKVVREEGADVVAAVTEGKRSAGRPQATTR